MNEIGKSISKAMFYFVALVLLVWSASLTVTFISTALPTLPWYVPILALVAFDGGMITWLFVFLKAAEGVIQRGTALVATIFDFLGVGLMVMSEILLGGQTLTAVPDSLGTWAIWGIGIWTVANIAAVILYHIGDPEAQKQMSIQNEKDAIWKGALADLASRRTHNSRALAAQLGGRMYDEMLSELFVDSDGHPALLQSRNDVLDEDRRELGGISPRSYEYDLVDADSKPTTPPPSLSDEESAAGYVWIWAQIPGTGNGWRWTLALNRPSPAPSLNGHGERDANFQ